MSYLNLSSLNVADSQKGTVSLWFRVSGDSVGKASIHGANYPDDQQWPLFRGTIPLITFGRPLTGTNWALENRLDCYAPGYGTNPARVAYSPHPVNLGDSPVEPTHIGLTCWNHGDDTFFPRLLIVLRSQTRPTASGLWNERIECHFSGEFEFYSYVLYETVAEASYIYTGEPARFTIEPKFPVATDVWHHVLASWDISHPVDTVALLQPGGNFGFPPGAAITGACKFYLAFDDQNKSGQDNIGTAWAYQGDNDIVPDGAFLADFSYTPSHATDPLGEPLVTGNVNVVPQWHWDGSAIPLHSGPVGLPATAQFVNNVYHVEMAELQFFVGLVHDTADVAFRRAFVGADGKPINPSDTEKILGRRPDILLSRTGNWQQGKNTGSTGLIRDASGDIPVASGQFTPTGFIDKYKPDPILQRSRSLSRVQLEKI